MIQHKRFSQHVAFRAVTSTIVKMIKASIAAAQQLLLWEFLSRPDISLLESTALTLCCDGTMGLALVIFLMCSIEKFRVNNNKRIKPAAPARDRELSFTLFSLERITTTYAGLAARGHLNVDTIKDTNHSVEFACFLQVLQSKDTQVRFISNLSI